MRSMLAIAVLGLLPACANPWSRLPEAAVPEPVRHGMALPSPFVFGNYCGFGTRNGDLSAPAVDRLDQACRVHDACYIARNDHCDCDGALVAAAGRIRDDTTLSSKLRRRARLLIATFAVPVCRAFPQGFMPPRDRTSLAALGPAFAGATE